MTECRICPPWVIRCAHISDECIMVMAPPRVPCPIAREGCGPGPAWYEIFVVSHFPQCAQCNQLQTQDCVTLKINEHFYTQPEAEARFNVLELHYLRGE